MRRCRSCCDRVDLYVQRVWVYRGGDVWGPMRMSCTSTPRDVAFLTVYRINAGTVRQYPAAACGADLVNIPQASAAPIRRASCHACRVSLGLQTASTSRLPAGALRGAHASREPAPSCDRGQWGSGFPGTHPLINRFQPTQRAAMQMQIPPT